MIIVAVVCAICRGHSEWGKWSVAGTSNTVWLVDTMKLGISLAAKPLSVLISFNFSFSFIELGKTSIFD